MVVPVDIVDEQWAGRSANGGNMEFHFDTADSREIVRLNTPFCTLAIAFQEIAAPGHPDKRTKRAGRHHDLTTVPHDFLGSPVAKCSLNDPDRNIIQPDIFPQELCSDRFYGDYMVRIPRGPDTECSHICTDIDDLVAWTNIIEPVFRYVIDLAEWRITPEESGIIR
jgi:hypothetical protein